MAVKPESIDTYKQSLIKTGQDAVDARYKERRQMYAATAAGPDAEKLAEYDRKFAKHRDAARQHIDTTVQAHFYEDNANHISRTSVARAASDHFDNVVTGKLHRGEVTEGALWEAVHTKPDAAVGTARLEERARRSAARTERALDAAHDATTLAEREALYRVADEQVDRTHALARQKYGRIPDGEAMAGETDMSRTAEYDRLHADNVAATKQQVRGEIDAHFKRGAHAGGEVPHISEGSVAGAAMDHYHHVVNGTVAPGNLTEAIHTPLIELTPADIVPPAPVAPAVAEIPHERQMVMRRMASTAEGAMDPVLSGKIHAHEAGLAAKFGDNAAGLAEFHQLEERVANGMHTPLGKLDAAGRKARLDYLHHEHASPDFVEVLKGEKGKKPNMFRRVEARMSGGQDSSTASHGGTVKTHYDGTTTMHVDGQKPQVLERGWNADKVEKGVLRTAEKAEKAAVRTAEKNARNIARIAEKEAVAIAKAEAKALKAASRLKMGNVVMGVGAAGVGMVALMEAFKRPGPVVPSADQFLDNLDSPKPMTADDLKQSWVSRVQAQQDGPTLPPH